MLHFYFNYYCSFTLIRLSHSYGSFVIPLNYTQFCKHVLVIHRKFTLHVKIFYFVLLQIQMTLGQLSLSTCLSNVSQCLDSGKVVYTESVPETWRLVCALKIHFLCIMMSSEKLSLLK